MQGEISKGYTEDKEVALTGDLTVTGGNHVNPQITTNGFAFTTEPGCVLRAPVIDGSRDPSAWGPNVTIDGVLHLEWKRGKPLAIIINIDALLERGGDDARVAWTLFVAAVHGSTPSIEWVDFKTIVWPAVAGDNITYLTGLVNAIKPAMPDGWGWDKIRDWMNGKTRDQLLGFNTEIDREVG